MNTHEFDDIIKQKAQQRETAVTPDIWEGINKKKKKRRMPFFWLTMIMLLLGTTTIVWNINENKTVDTASIQKNNSRQNDINNKRTTDKSLPPSLIKQVNDATHLKDNSTEDIDHSIVIGDRKSNTISKSNSRLNKNRVGVEKNSNHVPVENKNESLFATNKMMETNTKKIFSSHDNKRKTKGSARVKIKAGETGDVEDDIVNEEKRFSSIINKLNNNAVANTNIIAGESDSLLNATVATGIDDETLNKSTELLKIDTVDSLVTKKSISIFTDSTVNKKPIAITGINSKTKKKNNNLKIEAGITVVFPYQQYKQPLYVKRILNKTNVHSEFISANIKTTIESGAGFSVSFIKNLHKKWSAGTGIQFMRITERLQFSGIESNDNYTIVQRLVNDPNGNFLKADTVSSITKDNTTLTGRNIYTNISIPVFMRYQLLNRKKWSASLTAGVYIDLLRKYHNDIPGKFETVYSYGTESATSKNTIGFDLFAGLHVEEKISKKFAWFAEPSFRYNLSAYKTNNLSLNKKIHKPGLSVGISRSF